MAEYEALTKQFLSLPGATEHGYVTKTVLLSSLSDELVMLPLIEEVRRHTPPPCVPAWPALTLPLARVFSCWMS